VRRAGRILVVCAILAAGAVVAAPADAHTPHDDIFDVAVSPQFSTDGTVITISRGVMLRSTDGGGSFERSATGFDERTPLTSVAFAGATDARLYALSVDAVFRSDDAGMSWHRVLSGNGLEVLATSSVSTDVALVADGTTAWLTQDHGNGWRTLTGPKMVTAATFAPGSANTAFVGDRNGTLSMTRDRGVSWTSTSLGSVGAITSITFSPQFATDGVVLIGTEKAGLFRWNDKLASATRLSAGITDPHVTSIAFSARYWADGSIFVSTWNAGVFRSQDRGATWRLANTGLTKNAQSASLDRPNFGRLRSTLQAAPLGPLIVVATYTGLHVSRDAGATWTYVDTLYSNIDVGLAISPSYALDHTVAVTTYIDGAFVSGDAGGTWSPSNAGLEQAPLWNAAPDRFARLYNIVFNPAVPSQLFSASTDGLLRSSDRGATWNKTAIAGFTDGFDDSEAAHIPFVLVSPAFAQDHTVLLVDGGTGAVFRSTDGGLSFTKVGSLPAATASVHCLKPSPLFALDHRIYACAASRVYVSTNLGATWTATAAVPSGLDFFAIAVTSGHQTWFGANTRGMYRSTNLGGSWTRVVLPKPAGDTQVAALAVSPPGTSAATVLITIRGLGLYRSTDGGVTFARVATPLVVASEQFDNFNFKATAVPIVMSPSFNSDHTAYAFSFNHLFKSTDAGTTWQQLPTPYATHSMP
jgi:photosystem II stability/assembly factor-like uncharacterized protein